MTTVTLPSDLGIESASDLKSLLSLHIDATEELVVDGSQASRLHCASLQLLAAFIRSRAEAGHTTQLITSPALQQSSSLLGLSILFGSESNNSQSYASNQEKSA